MSHNKKIPDYHEEIEIIVEAMQKRLIQKYDKHKNSWTYTSEIHQRERVKFMFLNSVTNKETEDEMKWLLDLSNQAMLLYIRLKQKKEKEHNDPK